MNQAMKAERREVFNESQRYYIDVNTGKNIRNPLAFEVRKYHGASVIAIDYGTFTVYEAYSKTDKGYSFFPLIAGDLYKKAIFSTFPEISEEKGYWNYSEFTVKH